MHEAWRPLITIIYKMPSSPIVPKLKGTQSPNILACKLTAKLKLVNVCIERIWNGFRLNIFAQN